MPVPLRRTGAVSCGVVIGSLVLARVIATTGSRLLLALVFIVFVGAAVTLFAVVIAWCQASDDEIDAADPVRETNRGVIARTTNGCGGTSPPARSVPVASGFLRRPRS